MTFVLSLFEYNGSSKAATGGVLYEKAFFSKFRKIFGKLLRGTASETY